MAGNPGSCYLFCNCNACDGVMVLQMANVVHFLQLRIGRKKKLRRRNVSRPAEFGVNKDLFAVYFAQNSFV